MSDQTKPCAFCGGTKQMQLEGVVYDQSGGQHLNPVMPCSVCWTEDDVSPADREWLAKKIEQVNKRHSSNRVTEGAPISKD